MKLFSIKLNRYCMPNIKPISILSSFVFLFLVLYPTNFQASEAYPGYTLFSIDKTAYLYDMNGKKFTNGKSLKEVFRPPLICCPMEVSFSH